MCHTQAQELPFGQGYDPYHIVHQQNGLSDQNTYKQNLRRLGGQRASFRISAEGSW